MGALYSLWEQGVRGCSGRGEGGSGHLSNGPRMSRGTHRTAWAAPVVRGGRARADFEDGLYAGCYLCSGLMCMYSTAKAVLDVCVVLDVRGRAWSRGIA